MRYVNTMQTHQKGLALISVLFITALVVTIITAISHRQTLDIQLTGNLVFRAQAFQYAKGAEVYASELLFKDFESDDDGKVKDSPDDYWVKYGAVMPLDDGLLEVELHDLQGLFNLNRLIDSDGKKIEAQVNYLKRLVSRISDNEDRIPDEIVESIVDWIDYDNESTGLGAEEGEYLAKDPAYRTLNYLFSDADELLLIEGMNFNYFAQLSPFVTALPDIQTQININLAPKEVILALNDEISSSAIDELIEDRENDKGFDSVSDFLAHEAFAGVTSNLNAGDFTVFSSYFLLKSRVTLGDRVVQMYSVLWRDPETGKSKVISRNLAKRFKPTKPLFEQ